VYTLEVSHSFLNDLVLYKKCVTGQVGLGCPLKRTPGSDECRIVLGSSSLPVLCMVAIAVGCCCGCGLSLDVSGFNLSSKSMLDFFFCAHAPCTWILLGSPIEIACLCRALGVNNIAGAVLDFVEGDAVMYVVIRWRG